MHRFKLFAPWLAFLLLFACGWRTYDLLHHIPAYGDALEVIWGIEWYHDALFVQRVSPLFSPLVFHPNGWQVASLAHTPLLFLMGAILMVLGATSALSYNLLVIGSLLVAFAGARRFFRNYAGEIAATCAALVFTFIGMRWERLGGHLHVLLATSLLPWYLASLYQAFSLSETQDRNKLLRNITLSGFWWGLMMNFSLYAIFWGPIGFVIGGWRRLSLRRLGIMAGVSVVAFLLAAPLIALYYHASSIELSEKQGILYLLLGWGTSVDSLFISNRNHFIPWIRGLANSLYHGPLDESGLMNLGMVTWLLAIWGILTAFRAKHQQANGLLWLSFVGLLLSGGVLLRWQGWFIELPILSGLDRTLWHWGHTLKPVLFDSIEPPFFFDQGVPLPGYLLAIFVPFWESARVLARYAFVGGIGVIGLAAFGLQRIKGWPLYLFAALWLVESLPSLTGSFPLPPQPHPAFTWLTEHPVAPGEGIVDLTADPARMTSGEILYATRFHHQPTVSGVGSFAPRQLEFIQKLFYADPNALSKPQTAQLLLGYGARYALLHVQQTQDWSVWEQIKANPALRPLECFDPLQVVSPWPYPICIAEISQPPLWPTVNVMLDDGWSGSEEWGVWAEGKSSTARWVATRASTYVLQIRAFPYCPADQAQSLTIRVNGQIIADHQWQTCEEWQGDVRIAGGVVTVGWNQLAFDYGYARAPVDRAGQATGDPRQLSVGFGEIHILQTNEESR